MEAAATTMSERLRLDGYCVVPNMLGPTRLATLQEIATKARSAGVDARLDRDRFAGLVSELSELPDLAACLLWPELRDVLTQLGYLASKWFMGFLIQKPPKSEALYWHQDWWGWSDPCSYEPAPPLVFLMFYLVDVEAQNGCLRVLPGSHTRAMALHETSAREDYIHASSDVNYVLDRQLGEIDVPVHKGDLIVRDARLLHATHGNRSSDWRPMLSLSVAPQFDDLPQPVKRMMEIKRPKLEHRWPVHVWHSISSQMSVGPATGAPTPINRKPDFRGLDRRS